MVVTSWACIKCGVTNEKTAFKCQTCQEPKPIFWECSKCKVKNPTASLKCNGCKRKRPAIFGNTNVYVSNKMPPTPASSAGHSSNSANTAALWPGAHAQPKGNQGPIPFPSNYSQQSKSNSTSVCSQDNQMTSAFNSTISSFSSYSGASTISQVSGNHSTMSSLSQSVSSYDIFVKLNKPNRTVKQIVFNEVEGENKFRQALESCARTGGVYYDSEFKPSLYLLYFEPKVKRLDTSLPRIFWLRPSGMRPIEMAFDEKSPVANIPWAVMKDPVVSDITQGILGNCWLLSALVLLVEKPALLDKVLVTKEFIPQGVYHVRLYKDGRLTSVVVDDQLPCNNKRLLVYSSAKRKQLFVPLIEKAMSRLFGCYESLVAGQTCEGLSALTGFPCRSIRTLAVQRSELGNVGNQGESATMLEPDYIWAMLLSFQSAGFLMGAGCSCAADARIPEEEFLQRGLITQHAYTILNVVNLQGNIRLLQLRNPWGSKVWTGDWSDSSRTWHQGGGLGASLREQLQPYRASEGIFWISFADFQRYFEKVDVCKIRTGWQELRFEGFFPCSCADLRYLSVFEVQVEEPSTELEITLHQESRRAVNLHKTPLLPICVSIYQLKDVQMKTCGDLVDFSGYKMREFLGCDVMLDKGVYLIALYAFNHWSTSVVSSNSPSSSKSGSQKGGKNIRPRFVMSCHSSRPVTINCHCPAATIPGDTLLELVTARGQRTQYDDYVFSYYLTDNWSGMVVVVENHHSSSYLEVIFDASESTNLHSTRGSLLTQDTIPPMSRQLVNVFSHLDPSTAYYLTHDLSYRVSGKAACNHYPDLGALVPLHSPRSIKK